AFKQYPDVKAVIVVHLYGLSADMDSIMDVCNQYSVPVIEDAAESLGTLYKGKQTGTFGDYGVYSFNGNKIITSSGGGMLVSNNEERIEKARFLATQSRDNARHYQHSELGYNYRMSNVSAGIGRGQLKVLEERVKQKQYIYNFYKEALKGIEEISFMPDNDWDFSNRWLSVITLNGLLKPIEVIEALEKENIEARPVWKPMHLQPYFEEFDCVGGNVSQKLFENGVCLPSDTKMTKGQLETVVDVIKRLWVV